MFQKLLVKIHDPNVSLDRIISCLTVSLGQSTVRSVIGAGLIHIQQLSDINAKDVISRINKDESNTITINTTSTDINNTPKTNIFSDRVFNNKDLCYRILSHCDGKEINQRITFINKYFNNICNNPQTYQQLKYSKSIVGKRWNGSRFSKNKNEICQESWYKQSPNIISRYRHCNYVSVRIDSVTNCPNVYPFYTMKNIESFEKFSKIKHLYLDSIYRSPIGDKFFAILDKLFVTNKNASTMAENVEYLHIHSQYSSDTDNYNYTAKICSLINRAPFCNLAKLDIALVDFGSIMKNVTGKDICKQNTNANENGSITNGSCSFPKLKQISVYTNNYTGGSDDTVIDCKVGVRKQQSDRICKQCLLFWNSWYDMVCDGNKTNNNQIWMQLTNVDLTFKYCKRCLPKLFDKIYKIASKLINLESINFENNSQLPQWFLLHFIYGVVESQLKYHKYIKLKNIQCCQINDDDVGDDIEIDTNINIGNNVTEYKKILPKLLVPCVEKVAISCSEIFGIIPEWLFGSCNNLELKSQSGLKQLNVNVIEKYQFDKIKFEIPELIDKTFSIANHSRLETIVLKATSDAQTAQKCIIAANKYINLSHKQKKIIIDWEMDVYELFFLDDRREEQTLGFEKEYIPFFDALVELIGSGIDCNIGTIVTEFLCNLTFTGPELDGDVIISRNNILWYSLMLQNAGHQSIGAKFPNLNKFYSMSFENGSSQDYGLSNRLLKVTIARNDQHL